MRQQVIRDEHREVDRSMPELRQAHHEAKVRS
jgi:hypothetical protein